MDEGGSLDVSEDIGFEQRFWKIERIGWAVMAMVIVCALAGLLGPGPLSKQRRADATGSISAEYNRFDRYQAPTMLRLMVPTNLVENGEVRVSLSAGFVDSIELQHVDPTPEHVETTGDEMTFVFLAPDIAQNASIVFHYQPNRFGRTPATVAVGKNTMLHLSQFFYP
jgi:hypothetical protein